MRVIRSKTKDRPAKRAILRSLRTLRMTIVGLLAAVSARAQVPAGGDGTIYVGTYARNILVLDEATMRIKDSIHSQIGIPSLSLSSDRKHFYLSDPASEKIEIIDIASKRSLGVHTLSNDSTKVRMSGFSLDPKERFAVLLIKVTTKHRDRYDVGRPTLVRYDLAKRAVTDTIPWPRGEEREGVQIIFSPNGDLMYFFTTDDVLIYDTSTLKEVDRWDISRTTLFEEGLGRINFGFQNDIYETPGFYTGLFRSSDPVNHRGIMGVARMDLVNRQLDYYPLGPTNAVSFRLAPDHKRAYGLHSEVGNYQFWTFDLESHRVIGKTEFDGRPRMGLVVGSNGSQLYIVTAGATIDRYSTADFKHLGTVQLGADMTNVILLPRSSTQR
ncbi:MAG: hypothetical protein JWM41_2066 [Gemmatimonadetes bacterium]|nr:hypothetical protein [Gemmatimonadota bacterium]